MKQTTKKNSLFGAVMAAMTLHRSPQVPEPTMLPTKARQAGDMRLVPWSILRCAGNPRGYAPGSHPAGTRVKFSDRSYVVKPGGNLVRV